MRSWPLLLAACGSSPSPAEPDASIDAPACTPTAGPAAASVVTTSGTVHGDAAGATLAYRGIRYATAPRFARPGTAPCDGDQQMTVCPQLDDAGTFSGVEDCLRLGVWAPSTAAAARPVFVWIHGGANVAGAATDPVYDGAALATTGDMVVVTIDYRLGQLGFADHPALAAEDAAAGTYGLLDQLAALTWVKTNIAAFGGDPANVTVAGESAGARDVCSIVAAPSAAGLFSRAIIESGSCRGLPTRDVAQQQGLTFAAAANCTTGDVAACLRALTAEQIIRAAPGTASILVSTPYQPEIDGVIQPVEPEAAIAAGTHNHAALIVGSNALETNRELPAIADEAAYEAAVQTAYGARASQVLAEYPAGDFPTPRAAYVRVTTDGRFVCPSRAIARDVAAGQSEPVYRYFFSYAPTALGAVHGLELPFVFGTLASASANYTPTAADLAVSAAMQADWTAFARGGAPTASWPVWTPSDPVRTFDTSAGTMTGVRTAYCDFWDQLAGTSLAALSP